MGTSTLFAVIVVQRSCGCALAVQYGRKYDGTGARNLSVGFRTQRPASRVARIHRWRQAESSILSKLAYIRACFRQEESVYSSNSSSSRANHPEPKPLPQKGLDALAPDPHARTNAINFLLAAVCTLLHRYLYAQCTSIGPSQADERCQRRPFLPCSPKE